MPSSPGARGASRLRPRSADVGVRESARPHPTSNGRRSSLISCKSMAVMLRTLTRMNPDYRNPPSTMSKDRGRRRSAGRRWSSSTFMRPFVPRWWQAACARTPRFDPGDRRLFRTRPRPRDACRLPPGTTHSRATRCHICPEHCPGRASGAGRIVDPIAPADDRTVRAKGPLRRLLRHAPFGDHLLRPGG